MKRLLLFTCLMILAMTAVSAATITVPADFSSIQEAIDNATDGDVIEVLNGTYTENVNIGKQITLTSANPLLATVVGIITVTADNAELSGLTITNPNGSFGVIADDSHNLLVEGNVFENIGTAGDTGDTQGIWVVTGSEITIDNNIFRHINAGAGKSAKAVLAGGGGVLETTANLTIQNNAVFNITSPDWGAYGFLINRESTNPSIHTNVISGLSGLWVHAISLDHNTPGASVIGNDVSDVTGTGFPGGAINIESNANAETVAISQNNLVAPRGVINQMANLTVDATLNWWADASGPGGQGSGTGANTTGGSISFDPWLCEPAFTGNVSVNGSCAPADSGNETGNETGAGNETEETEFDAGDIVRLDADGGLEASFLCSPENASQNLTVDWSFGENVTFVDMNATIDYTFPQAGDFLVQCQAWDDISLQIYTLGEYFTISAEAGGNGTGEENETGGEAGLSADLSIKPWFPQGSSVVWVCDVSGGSGNYVYDYHFGDGEKLLGTDRGDVYYTYKSNGIFNASCTVNDLDTSEEASSSATVTIGDSEGDGGDDTGDEEEPEGEMCYESLSEIPAECTGGTVTSDSGNSCRTITCESSGASLTVKACEKPDTGEKTHFEMYKQSSTGSGLEVCLAGTCLSSAQYDGYAKSEQYPVCTGESGSGDEGAGSGDEEEPTASVELSIAQWYPRGGDYVFVCNASGFSNPSYDWNFGDGSKLVDSGRDNVFHSYTAGDYTVFCTAEDEENSVSDTLEISVS